MLRSRLPPQSVTSDNSVPDRGRAEAQRILAIEDDSATQRALKRLFESEGYDVDLAKDGTSGLAHSQEEAFSDPPRFGVCRTSLGKKFAGQITRLAPGLPIIVLSAKADVADKVVLLEMGARDYVTKPFSPRELLARARAALRSAPNGLGECLLL
jgi:two-component system alkaline phosphatase synthesis response regulator PhoP